MSPDNTDVRTSVRVYTLRRFVFFCCWLVIPMRYSQYTRFPQSNHLAQEYGDGHPSPAVSYSQRVRTALLLLRQQPVTQRQIEWHVRLIYSRSRNIWVPGDIESDVHLALRDAVGQGLVERDNRGKFMITDEGATKSLWGFKNIGGLRHCIWTR